MTAELPLVFVNNSDLWVSYKFHLELELKMFHTYEASGPLEKHSARKCRESINHQEPAWTYEGVRTACAE